MAGKHLSIVLFLCIAIVTVKSQNITRSENPPTLSRQGALSQQRGGNNGQRDTFLNPRGNNLLGVPSIQRDTSQNPRGNNLLRVPSIQRDTSLNPRGNNLLGVPSIQRNTFPQQRGNTAQRVSSTQRRGNTGQRVTSPQRTGSDGSRRSLVQLRRSRPQRRPILNLQNLPRPSGSIPRARNFQDSLRNIPRRDPRTGIISRGIRPRVISSPLAQRTGTNNNPLCASPRSIRCYSWPRNQDPRSAYICDGRCQGRSCSVPCECSCVDPRLIDRLIAIGRISGPELTPRDPRLRDGTRRQRLRERILALQAARRRRLPVQTGSNSNRGGQTTDLPQRSSNFDLNFGISDDVLATLIAQPVLNEIVGPQGINQIIAGEPPPLLLREERRPRFRSSSRTNNISQPDIRAVKTSPPSAEQRVELLTQDRSMGIPVPLSRLNFAPGTESNPAMGNMRLIMSDVRPFEDPTVGLNIDIPNPTPVDMPAESQVTVRQLPGTSVLFVDLTRSSPNGQSRGGMPPVNMTSTGTGSISRNNVLIPNTNQTLSGSVINGGTIRTFHEGTVSSMNPPVGRPLTQDECLAQRTELWCDPKEPWSGTPGLFRWCLLNCRADNCDTQRCACACIDELLFKTKYEQLSLRAP